MRPKFIAEASSNHGRDLSRALAFVDAAADAGCDAVKFQLFKIDRMFAPEILSVSAKHQQRRAWELPHAHLAPLAERCRAREIEFSCTPFYVEAVEELRPFVDFYKIASYELLYAPLLEACAATGKPIVLSTGMATMEEIRAAAAQLQKAGARDITLLHCVSAYPTPAEEANLSAIESIRSTTGCAVGWSDHTRKPAVIERAVHRWNAAAIEFHLDLDGTGAEYAAGHCWLPGEIAPVIARIRESLIADGAGFKGPQPSERGDRDWRADPADGMRPLKHIRAAYKADGVIPARVVAIVQARMGSTRLPGKVLKPIAGQPLLWHIVHRLKACKTIDDITIATSTNPRDDAIVEFGREHGVKVTRGSENDVLARFAAAAQETDADVIVRVSSDAPFIDADFVDHLVTSLVKQGGGYVLLEDGAITAHEGVDPFSRSALQKLVDEAPDDPVAREHVTGYFKLHPDFVKIVRAAPYPPLARAGARLTVDTPDDLAFVEAVHARLNARAGQASLTDLLLLLEREPKLRQINSHVAQKRIDLRPALALIRCDGGGRFGYGHVKRMLSLARALRDRHGIGVMFALNGTADVEASIVSAGFECFRVNGASDAEDLGYLIDTHAPDVLICDMREGARESDLRALKKRVSLLALVDDGSDRRLAADVAYYPPVPQALTLDWAESTCVRHIGWEWTLLGMKKPEISRPSLSAAQTVLVTMGGSDPAGLTLRAARTFAAHAPGLRANFVVGAGVKEAERIAHEIRTLSANFNTIEGAENLADAYANCGIALCAFGVTAYELAANGVPAIYISLTDDHAQSAFAFEQAGMGMSLGLHDRIEDRNIATAVRSLLSDPGRRDAMRTAGMSTIDGEGAGRIAADLRRLLEAGWDARPAAIAAA